MQGCRQSDRRQIEMDTAWPKVVGVHASAGGTFVKFHQPFAFFEAHRNGVIAPTSRPNAQIAEQVVQDSRDLRKEHPNVFALAGAA